MTDPTTTLTLRAFPQSDVPLLGRLAQLLASRVTIALAVALMWGLAIVDWLSIYAGNAPNRKVFYAIVIMAAALAAGRIRHGMAAKRR
jgi:hypothetical protein